MKEVDNGHCALTYSFILVKYLYRTPPMEFYWKFHGKQGSQKPKFLKESMKPNLYFQRDGEFKPKNFPGEIMDIFWNNKIFRLVLFPKLPLH